MWWILVAVAVVTVVYWRLVRPHKYWTEKGVKQGNPRFLVGDFIGPSSRTESIADVVKVFYNTNPNTRYSGVYQFLRPILIIKDPDLIKQITVKDFDHFLDHQSIVPEDVDPLWATNLLASTGKRWREMRATLSPAFTSSKMKHMFSLISQTGAQFIKHFLDMKEDVITIEIKDTCTRFTNDVIYNTAFGVECDSLRERDNEFYLMGKEATNFTGFWKNIKFVGFFLIPRILKLFNIMVFTQRVSEFFSKLIKSNIASREKHNIVRPDMIHLLLEARKHGLKHEESQPDEDAGFATVEESEIGKTIKNRKREITDLDITSQALVFFFAGFDSVSNLMCFMSYELGVNPDIQERLIQEVDETMDNCKGELTYEALVKMKYMDMIVCETLRKWPSFASSDRVCTKPYTIEPKTPDEKPLHLEKGAVLWLPIYGIQHDPRHYPDPERFDPERFSDENKGKINPYTYIPFGTGPRNCIGSRFALLETKILFCYILSQFQIVPVEKTHIPLVLNKSGFSLTPEGKLWFGLKRRAKS